LALENVAFGLKMKGVPKGQRHETALHYLEITGLKGQEHKYPREL